MADLILHHYDLSPFAEKIRLALGVKGLPWRSVDTPMNLPKPDHFELTGGYRRVPVLQIGADVYCDTHLITRVLDRVQPTPPLSPPGQETLEFAVSQWAESSFMMAILAFFGIGGVFDEDFVEDRKKTMTPPGQSLDAAGVLLGTKLLQLRDHAERLEAMLANGRAFLLGETVSAADLSAYHPIAMLGIHPHTKQVLDGLTRLTDWMERIAAIGHGERIPFDAKLAIEVAHDAEPAAYAGAPVVPEGMKIGDPVVVLPDEFGSGNVSGTLAPSGLSEIAVRRATERAGDVVVHFPRESYSLIAAG